MAEKVVIMGRETPNGYALESFGGPLHCQMAGSQRVFASRHHMIDFATVTNVSKSYQVR